MTDHGPSDPDFWRESIDNRCFSCGTPENPTKGVYAYFCASCMVEIQETQNRMIRHQFAEMFAEMVKQTHTHNHLQVGEECITCRVALGEVLRFAVRHGDVLFPKETQP